jgi:hypothetical protein
VCWTHPLVYECKQMCKDLLEDAVEVEIMWITANMGQEGNEIVDERTRHAALNGAVFEKPLPPVDFRGLARSVLLRVTGEVGLCRHCRFANSNTWFEARREDRKFVSTVTRIISGHFTARTHLSRFRIVEGAVCILEWSDFIWGNFKQ